MLTVRLSEGANATYGAVQVFQNNTWTLVCDDGWTDKAAKVTCRSLGHTDGRAIPQSGFGNLNLPISVGQVACVGNETDLLLCPLQKQTPCKSGMYASVQCTNETIDDLGKTKLYLIRTINIYRNRKC